MGGPSGPTLSDPLATQRPEPKASGLKALPLSFWQHLND
ncbi:hypothetical protein GLE_1128 [Lysobacter enzymogenes]|uniref:Uncharacterized protein n=1 Tax=Lysobacter enzymogenes TaxID=69 RepID=A0A0S2DD56_LYSEN|nr:hypothetical protein GLE_1128 [Lysobacter enzymogenes]